MKEESANKSEREYVEELLRRRRRGERLTDAEEAQVAYSPYGTAASCSCSPLVRLPRPE